MSVEPCQRISPGELQAFSLFKDDGDAALAWLAERFEVVCYQAGDTVFNEGDKVNWFMFLLEGELQYSRSNNPSLGIFSVGAGEATGVLPFSRLKTSQAKGSAARFTRLARMEASHLRELVYQAPNLAQKLVALMTDRTREFTQMAERNSKMVALGKLSAGLAHELNNPASAAVRSSTRLREMLLDRRKNAVALRAQFFPEQIQKTMEQLAEATVQAARSPAVLDDLERSDMEASLAEWLESNGLQSDKAADLVCAGLTLDILEPARKAYDPAMLDKILSLLLADHQMLALISEVEEAARRISQLVQDVKAYSYMDTSPVELVDVSEGIRATMRMFQHQLKHGFTIRKQFAENLPKIQANGNELNQVWTNLIDNAIDAMENQPADRRVLEIKTIDEPGCILIEIGDSGEGIPTDVQGRIFEPFFTTKGVGQGTGLGLDIVQRIVHKHRGSIKLESEPGHTVFQIRLPK